MIGAELSHAQVKLGAIVEVYIELEVEACHY